MVPDVDLTGPRWVLKGPIWVLKGPIWVPNNPIEVLKGPQRFQMGSQNGKCVETARGVFRNEGIFRSRSELSVLTGVRGYILIWSSDWGGPIACLGPVGPIACLGPVRPLHGLRTCLW